MAVRATARRLVLAALLLGASPVAGQEAVTFRLNFAAGQTYGFVTKSSQKSTASLTGMEQTTDQTTELGSTMTVLDRMGDGSTRVEITYDYVLVTGTGPQGEVHYDSRDPDAGAGPMVAGTAAMVGSRLRLTLAPDGAASGFEGVSEMVDRMLAANADQFQAVPPEALEAMREQMGDRMLSQTFEGMTGFFPDGPVRPGDTWTQSTEIGGPFGGLRLEGTWRFVELSDGIAVIEGDMNVVPGSGGGLDVGAASVSYSMTGTQTARLEVDVSTGWTVRSRVDQDLSGTMSLGAALGQSMPITVKGTTWIQPKPGG